MKPGKYKLLITILCIAGSAKVSLTGQHLPDSLASYLEIAAKNNPGVQQKLLEYQAALQKVPQVGSLPDPEISSGFFLKPMELISGKQVADLQLMQMFPWFGVLKNAKDEMSLMANSKFELFRDAKAQVYYDVKRSWYELFKIRAERRISLKNIEILKMIERIALVRFKSPSTGNIMSQPSGTMSSGTSGAGNPGNSAGMQNMSGNQASPGTAQSPKTSYMMLSPSMGSSSGGSGLSDLYIIQIELIELESDIELLNNQEKAVTARFNGYLNRDPLYTVYIDTLFFTDPLPFPEIAVKDSIPANNPMLNMIEYENQSLLVRKRMVTRMGYPMIGFGINYSIINKSSMSSSSMNGEDMVMPMVKVTLPIYRKKYNAMKSEADLLKSASEQNYISITNSLRSEFYNAYQLYKDALTQSKLYQSQHDLASKSLDLMLKELSSSSYSLTDVLRIWQQTLDYELKLVRSIADLNTSAALIRRLTASENVQ